MSHLLIVAIRHNKLTYLKVITKRSGTGVYVCLRIDMVVRDSLRFRTTNMGTKRNPSAQSPAVRSSFWHGEEKRGEPLYRLRSSEMSGRVPLNSCVYAQRKSYLH